MTRIYLFIITFVCGVNLSCAGAQIARPDPAAGEEVRAPGAARSVLDTSSLEANNTFLGAESGKANTEGSNNTAVGVSALSANGRGQRNTATGVAALSDNTTGSDNTAVGVLTLSSNTMGFDNTAIGAETLSTNETGFANTAVGTSGLFFNETGNHNTAVGAFALHGNRTGNENTAIGFAANVAGEALVNATAVGAGALVDASNKIRLGNNRVSVIEAPVSLTTVVDKTRIENLNPVDGEDVLKKIRDLTLTSWNAVGHDPEKFRHYGPMAQDFFAAFGRDGVGTVGTPTTINSADLTGILMIAVQALERRTREMAEIDNRITTLQRQTLQSTQEEIKAPVLENSRAVARPGDLPWFFTAEEIDSAYRYQENYGHRLRHPIDPASCLMGSKEFVASHQGKTFSAPCLFFNETVRHIKQMLESGAARYLFPLDAGHAHLMIPADLWGQKYRTMPADQILPALLREPSLRALYHTADHLGSADSGGGEIHAMTQARLQKHNVFASYDGERMAILQLDSHFPVPNGYEQCATIHFLAHRSGGLTIMAGSEPVTFDISFDDDSIVEMPKASETASYARQ